MNKKQWLITLFLVLCVGLVFGLRNLVLSRQALFTPFSGGDEDIYAAQINEVFEGKLFSGDAFSYETRNNFPIFASLAQLILGLAARLIHSVSLVFILSDFIFPAILFILFLRFVYSLTRQYWPAAVTALSTLFLYQLINKIPPVTRDLAQNLWQALTFKEPIFFFFNRLPPPQFTYIFFFLFITGLYRVLAGQRQNKFFPLIPGILSGLLSYMYFYHWSASVVIIGICLGFNLLGKNFVMAKKLLLTLGSSLIVSGGYFYQIFLISQIDKQAQAGFIIGRFFEPLVTLRYLLLSLFLFLVIRPRALNQLLVSIFISAVILVNLQLIFGFTMSPGHWPNSTFEPMVVIAAGILLIEILKQLHWQKILDRSWLVILPIFLYAVLNQAALIQRFGQMYYFSSSEKQVYDWLNHNSAPDSVVLSFNKLTSRRLPAVTHNYPYLPYGVYSQMLVDETWERFNLANSLVQFKQEFLTGLISRNNDLSGYLFGEVYRYHRLSDLSGLDFPPETKSIIAQTSHFFTFGHLYIPDNLKQLSYQKINEFKTLPLPDRLCRYKLDYLILKNSEIAVLAAPLASDIFRPVLQTEEFDLYQVNPGLCP